MTYSASAFASTAAPSSPVAAFVPSAWRARAVDGVLRMALVLAMDASDEDTAAAALVPLFFAPCRAAALTAPEHLRLAALAHALRSCLTDRHGNAAAWAVAAEIVHELTLSEARSGYG